jgi:hypothetical protein
MSPVNIGTLSSEVIPEPEPATTARGQDTTPDPWEEEHRFRRLQDRLAMNAERTQAWGFDA